MTRMSAQSMFLAIAAAMTTGSGVEKQIALSRIGSYKSRGKGRGTPSRHFGNKSGKYMPHQGPRECARRLRQQQRDLS